MNFTRDPIIETVITPKEGCKLVIRSSKGVDKEEYWVDAVEVVSFGKSVFFRSLERPKSFLVPVTDYEVIELRETRMVLKSMATEKIKMPTAEEEPKRRRRLRRSRGVGLKKGGETNDETKKVSSSIVRKLFPPPNSLIKEKLTSVKDSEKLEETVFAPQIEEGIKE